MRRVFRRSIVPLGISAAIPPLAFADWDPAKASSNLGIFALTDAQLAERKITVTPIGDLELPTGEIIACDPLVTGDDWPALDRKVKPGRYRVSLFEAQGRVAAAFLRFRPGVPVRWELATLPGQDVSTLNGDQVFGYPVDAGLGSFMDKTAMALMSAAQDKLKPDQNYYDDVLAAEFAPNQDRFVMHHPVTGNPANIAMFWSGWGDGIYPSFWGLDAAGEPLVLMTDFEVLENADGREGVQAN
ncbi:MULTISPECIES: DUF4241 domain-containing protein [unclassified Mesorhizobium]|uniref:DUF4241 domain-containing protein n=1 Tax=unclassified Mesorhizobium TaxID=325217 RepID=UPI000BAFBBBD|nr:MULTISPECIES: DUF4241 domain-containing protein [unclassified Mesorhizobium]TGT57202.1 DUF4241 domain-containing protein [Mesorhizobium sp. M00.F.Ca.ET.170.01.1.1]AZO13067.1 DUF4241 domain-containing protein [Mesorhizobium sp. M3A.F.Ca.ET.080.04.2.1]PBB88814.1 hypothetical protein CK216_03675 [Mesorhizobium sp. WSM3876]RWB66389.1 MAG: DUF4241 domain-containing protein [Mesorhizobium sp.]RWB92599.1 MAG: DUF4241 domain-containing protein [Mesorhizobium sp.]